jgi:hypothetical protein
MIKLVVLAKLESGIFADLRAGHSVNVEDAINGYETEFGPLAHVWMDNRADRVYLLFRIHPDRGNNTADS